MSFTQEYNGSSKLRSIPGKVSNASNPPISLRVTLEHLLTETCQYLTPEDLEKIQHAYKLADQAHRGAVRRSGEPYIQHPLEVALILADMRIDADGIVAALLHDVVEDTHCSLDDLRQQFGTAVATIVDGVTKFNILAEKSDGAHAQATETDPNAHNTSSRGQTLLSIEPKRRQRHETVRKVLLSMAEDPRVVVLKLADRLHNMRTIGVMSPAQQQSKSRETSEIYAPLASRLGMAIVQSELEDLAFRYLEPERHAWLAREIEGERRYRQPYTYAVCRILQEEMDRAGIAAEVYAWQKHVVSVNRKLQRSGGDVRQLHDLISFRILVDSDLDCYLALGHIHALWRPKDGRIKDFLATPKLNGYQSLHTTVFSLDNRLAEIQIRTHEMQRTANYGIASYWYLKKQGETHLSSREMLTWIEQVREWQRELPQTADEFVEAVKGDIFQEQIFVFTPKGEVKDLPRGSTPLDMAYRIHTDIGDHCTGARITTNMSDTGRLVTRLVPIDYELQGGEIVDIVVNNAAHPTHTWLSCVRTTAARTKIRRYLKTYEREINLQAGRERLEEAMKQLGMPALKALSRENFTPFLLPVNKSTGEEPVLETQKRYATLEDLYVAIGRESLDMKVVIDHLFTQLDFQDRHDSPQKYISKGDKRLAHCCYPLPGDTIMGILTSKRGLLIHRSNCYILRRYYKQERFVEVNWQQMQKQHYVVPITIVASDRAGLLRDVAAVIADANISMKTVRSTTNAVLQRAIITATLEIDTIEQVERICKRLRQIENILQVKRNLGGRI